MLGSVANAFAASGEESFSEKTKATLKSWYSNLPFVAILLYASWIMLGTVYYYYIDGWTFSTSFFFALQLGLSVGFCAPAEYNNESRLFSVFYILLGSSVVAGSVGRLATELLFFKIDISGSRKLIIFEEFYPGDEPEKLDFIKYAWYWFKFHIGWYKHRARIILCVCLILWLGVGVTYGMAYEGWGFILSLNFAVSALSTAGLVTPTCHGPNTSDCHLSDGRAAYLGIYLMIGVPLYTVTLGQFAGVVVEHAARRKALERMAQPIDADQFKFAATLLSSSDSSTLQLGEFIILELMRLGQTDVSQINKIKRRFDELNVKANDVLDFEELSIGGYIVQGKLERRFMSVQRPIMTVKDGQSNMEEKVARTPGQEPSTDTLTTFDNVEDAVRALREQGTIPLAPKMYDDDEDDDGGASDAYTSDGGSVEDREPRGRTRTNSFVSISDPGPRRYRKKRTSLPNAAPALAESPSRASPPAVERGAIELVDASVARSLAFETPSKH